MSLRSSLPEPCFDEASQAVPAAKARHYGARFHALAVRPHRKLSKVEGEKTEGIMDFLSVPS